MIPKIMCVCVHVKREGWREKTHKIIKQIGVKMLIGQVGVKGMWVCFVLFLFLHLTLKFKLIYK